MKRKMVREYRKEGRGEERRRTTGEERSIGGWIEEGG